MKMFNKEQKKSTYSAPDRIQKLINMEEARRHDNEEETVNAESKVVIPKPEGMEFIAEIKFGSVFSNDKFTSQIIPSAEGKQETDKTGAVPIVGPKKIDDEKLNVTSTDTPVTIFKEIQDDCDSKAVTTAQPKKIEKCEKILVDPQIPVEYVKQETKLEDVTKKSDELDELLVAEVIIPALGAEREKNKPEMFAPVTTEQPKRVDDVKTLLISESNRVHKIFYGNTLADAIPIISLSITGELGEPIGDRSEFVLTMQPKNLENLEYYVEEEKLINYVDGSKFAPIPDLSAEEEKQELDKFKIVTPKEKESLNMSDEISIVESMGEIEYNCLNRYIIKICTLNDYIAPVVFSIPILLVGACSFACGAFLPCASQVF